MSWDDYGNARPERIWPSEDYCKRRFPSLFLTHEMNHSRKSNRLVINICQRKSSITFSECGIYCSNNPFPKYLWLRIYLRLSPFGKLFESFLSTLSKSRWRDLCYSYWHENVNVLTILSRALLRIFSKHGVEPWNRPVNRRLVQRLRFCLSRGVSFSQPAHRVLVSSMQFSNHSAETKLYTCMIVRHGHHSETDNWMELESISERVNFRQKGSADYFPDYTLSLVILILSNNC